MPLEKISLVITDSSLEPALALDVGDDEEEDDDYIQEDDTFSDNDAQSADTPNTPFSPGRKRFPSDLKTIKCTYEGCPKTFNRPARLTAHLRSHTNERPYVCKHEGCDKAYMDEKHLKAHIKGSHTTERSYQCQWQGCGKSFLTSTRLNRHRAVHEGKNRFVCTEYAPCNQTFRKHQTLQRHIRSDHLELAPYPCTFVDPTTNIPCNAGFDGAGGLRKHQDKVHRLPQFFCPECLEPNMVNLDGTPMHLGFVSDTMLQAHIRKEHAKCPFCDLHCSSRRGLERHVESQHSGTTVEERKNIPCTWDGCPKTFTKKYNRDQHVLTAHEGQRYICGTFDVSDTADIAHWDESDACEKDFYSKANLEDHVRTAHLGLQSLINSKRKKSELKEEKATMPSELEQLTGTAYENDQRRTIACFMPNCAHKFIRDYDLQNHLRGNHRLTTPVIDEILAARLPSVGTAGALLAGIDGAVDGVEIAENFRNLQNGKWVVGTPQESAQAPFWIGADDGFMRDSPDRWAQESMEMRKLIDEEDFGQESS